MDNRDFQEYLKVEREAQLIRAKYTGVKQVGGAPPTKSGTTAELMYMLQKEMGKASESSSKQFDASVTVTAKKTSSTIGPSKSGVPPRLSAASVSSNRESSVGKSAAKSANLLNQIQNQSLNAQVDKTLERLRTQQVMLQKEHYRINLERFCKPTELLLRDKRKHAMRELLTQLKVVIESAITQTTQSRVETSTPAQNSHLEFKVISLKQKPKESRAIAFLKANKKRYVFDVLKSLVAVHKEDILNELEEFLKERDLLNPLCAS